MPEHAHRPPSRQYSAHCLPFCWLPCFQACPFCPPCVVSSSSWQNPYWPQSGKSTPSSGWTCRPDWSAVGAWSCWKAGCAAQLMFFSCRRINRTYIILFVLYIASVACLYGLQYSYRWGQQIIIHRDIFTYIYQMQGNTKYDLMSECLAMVKQLPRSLDGLQGQDCQPQLLDIIKCSSKFQQLAALPLTDSSLCHRFLCRLRDIVYSLSGRYLSGDGTRHPRALFAGINRKIMESKGGAGYELALLSVAGVINDWVLGVGRDRGLNLGDLQTAISEGQPQIVAMSESCPREKREEGRLRLESLDKLEQAKNDKKKSEQSFMKMVKLDIIADIDIGFLDQRNKQVKEEQIYKQCLQRNKYISILMKKYEEAYRGYESKPASRKNRDYADFKPTTQSKTISLVVRKRPGFHLNSPDCRANYKKMRSLHETLTGTLILDKELNPQQTKQQLLTQLYAYRKKYTMRKVMIGASDLDIKPATMNQTSRARELHKSRPKSQRPASSYKSQRIKATNNYSYIEGIVPVH